MKLRELKQLEGKYGLLTWDKTAERKAFHGTIKYVDEEESIVLFKIKGLKVQKIDIRAIADFEEKEMLGEVTTYGNRDVVWDGGLLCHPEDLQKRKEINLKR